jgi:hypothetical protein
MSGRVFAAGLGKRPNGSLIDNEIKICEIVIYIF